MDCITGITFEIELSEVNDKHAVIEWTILCVFGQAIEKDKKLRELREETRCVANPIGTNDFDYEDKQKTQDSILVYEGLHFNLAAENSRNTFFFKYFFVFYIIHCI